MSQTTKRALAASLKSLLEQKPLNKITVTDVAEDCGVNRQTFYYHFQDMYALLEWIYTQEAAQALEGRTDTATWQQGLMRLLEYAQKNRALIRNTYHSINRKLLEQWLYREIYRLLWDVVQERGTGLAVSEEAKASVAHFYKYAFVGWMLDWVERGMKEAPAQVTQKIAILVDGGIRQALERFARQEREQAPGPV